MYHAINRTIRPPKFRFDTLAPLAFLAKFHRCYSTGRGLHPQSKPVLDARAPRTKPTEALCEPLMLEKPG
jgi:hypothetical protein